MIFITGATGFLGRELLGRLLLEEDTSEICLLVRKNSQQSSETRIDSLLLDIFGTFTDSCCRDKIKIVEGDVTLENFGLGQDEFDTLAKQTTTVYHLAASTELNQPLSQAKNINVGGTAQVINLCKRSAKLNKTNPKLFHVSTAYVAGTSEGVVKTEELGKSFRNSYEATKAEAEYLVRANVDNFECCILRPSMIIGDSITGHTSAFNVIYLPARLLIQGICKGLPALPDVPFDLVPVDYVSDAIITLSKLTERRPCYHLSVGVGRESSPLEILTHLLESFGKNHPTMYSLLITPSSKATEHILKACVSNQAFRASLNTFEKILGTRFEAMIRQILPFAPYLLKNPQFDTSWTALDTVDILPPPPKFENYANKIFGYCAKTNWGKIPSMQNSSLSSRLTKEEPGFERIKRIPLPA